MIIRNKHQVKNSKEKKLFKIEIHFFLIILLEMQQMNKKQKK